MLIPRLNGYHMPCQMINFDGGKIWFKLPDKVEAHFAKGSDGKVRLGKYKPGVAVHLLLRRSKIDRDFQLPWNVVDFIITKEDLELLLNALEKSDELTADLLGKPGWGGKRPYASTKLHHYM